MSTKTHDKVLVTLMLVLGLCGSYLGYKKSDTGLTAIGSLSVLVSLREIARSQVKAGTRARSNR